MFGTNGLTKAHQEAIQRIDHLEEIIFALDGDAAGRAATKEHQATLKKLLPQIKITTLDLPEGEDINSLAVAHKDVKALLNHLFSKRTEVGKEVVPKKEMITKTLELEALEKPTEEKKLDQAIRTILFIAQRMQSI